VVLSPRGARRETPKSHVRKNSASRQKRQWEMVPVVVFCPPWPAYVFRLSYRQHQTENQISLSLMLSHGKTLDGGTSVPNSFFSCLNLNPSTENGKTAFGMSGSSGAWWQGLFRTLDTSTFWGLCMCVSPASFCLIRVPFLLLQK